MSMEKEVTVGLVQMGMTADKGKNVEKALKMISEAAKRGAKIVCLPELFNSAYFPQKEEVDDKSELAEPIPGPTTGTLSEAAKENSISLIGGSIYEKDGRRLFNTSVVFDENGKMIGKYRKIHIPNDPKFYEQNYFENGDLGYQVMKTNGAMVGVMICYDQWFPEAARVNALMGAGMIFYPTAIGLVEGVEQTEGDWQEAWENVQRGHAIANGVIVSAVNRVGKEGDMRFWGGSFVIDQFGKTLARAGNREEVVIVKCDLGLGRRVKEGWRFFYNRRPGSYQKLVER